MVDTRLPNEASSGSGPPRANGPARLRLLILDPDRADARALKMELERSGRFAVDLTASAEEALDRLAGGPLDAILTDTVVPGGDGVEFVERVRGIDRTVPVIMLASDVTLERVVEGMRAGATDFLPKPVNLEALRLRVERAVSERPLRAELSAAVEHQRRATVADYLLGSHPRLEAVRRFVEQIVQVPEASVLLTGETGTGKSLLARAIHDLSRPRGRFVEVNCATLPSTLMESELFGHEKGAFTDARTLKRGLVEVADRGTLFLDEISALPMELQAKLLLFLERKEVRRVGGIRSIPVRCRLITATNENLHQRVRDRCFRQDLLYRLDVASVEMPPLREIPSVTRELAEHFVRSLAAEMRRPVPELTDASFSSVDGHAWPGNARELRNVVERALIFHDGGPLVVRVPAYPDGHSTPGDGVVLSHGLTIEEVERRYLAAALDRHGGGMESLAAQLGISRKTLWEKRRRHGL